jgi:hypothetical protein
MKELILLGTRHYNENNMPGQNRAAMTFIIDDCSPQIVLEEWSEAQKITSGIAAVCNGKGVIWKSIGTPDTQEFTTYHGIYLDFPSSANIPQYGPIGTQEKREQAMCQIVAAAMLSVDLALVVIGLAHLHSMFLKLSGQFDVKGYEICA